MKKKIKVWKISDAGHKDSSLEHKYSSIDFPEYQREPTVWSRAAKQRLVDSILRQFDIASLYFYKDEDGSLDCIDGRQRIGAIMSFLEENENDKEDSVSVGGGRAACSRGRLDHPGPGTGRRACATATPEDYGRHDAAQAGDAHDL